MERRSRWRVVLVVAVVISMVSTTVALAQKAPTGSSTSVPRKHALRARGVGPPVHGRDLP
jgi:hypothetical protein